MNSQRERTASISLEENSTGMQQQQRQEVMTNHGAKDVRSFYLCCLPAFLTVVIWRVKQTGLLLRINSRGCVCA